MKKREPSPSRVFKLFDEGFSPIEVVEKTNAEPSKVKQWFRDWLEMRHDWGRFAFARSLAELEHEARDRLAELRELLGEDTIRRLQGKKPSGLLAAMAHIVAKEVGLKIPATKLAEYYGTTETLVYRNIKLLRQIMQDKGVKLHPSMVKLE